MYTSHLNCDPFGSREDFKMQALFALLRVVFGMKDVLWEGGLEREDSIGTHDVYAAEGPINPPKP